MNCFVRITSRVWLGRHCHGQARLDNVLDLILSLCIVQDDDGNMLGGNQFLSEVRILFF